MNDTNNVYVFHPSYTTELQSVECVVKELRKRGFKVQSLTRGFSQADLFTLKPGGETYTIDVKGQRKKICWLIKNPNQSSNFYYIFVLLIEPTPRIFVMPGKEVFLIWKKIKDNREIKKGSPLEKNYPNDIPFRAVYPWENRWDLLK
jgi:hypothetical protein